MFGRPYVGEEIDVKTAYEIAQHEDGPADVVSLLTDVGYDTTLEEIEHALQYAEDNPDEIQALQEDDLAFMTYLEDNGHDLGELGEPEYDDLYEQFLQEHDTEFDYGI